MSPTLTTSGTPYLQQQPSPHSSAAAAMTEDGMGAHIYAVCVLLLQLYLIIILCVNAFSEYLLTFSTPPPPSLLTQTPGQGRIPSVIHEAFGVSLFLLGFAIRTLQTTCKRASAATQSTLSLSSHPAVLCAVLCCAVCAVQLLC
jgi:hypothetical protein